MALASAGLSGFARPNVQGSIEVQPVVIEKLRVGADAVPNN
jgi:hypothetical protein